MFDLQFVETFAICAVIMFLILIILWIKYEA